MGGAMQFIQLGLQLMPLLIQAKKDVSDLLGWMSEANNNRDGVVDPALWDKLHKLQAELRSDFYKDDEAQPA